MNGDLMLLSRLRELLAIDIDALIGTGPGAAPALAAFTDDLRDALAAAKASIAGLAAEWKGPDPLLFIDAPVAARASEKGRSALLSASERLVARARASRQQAALIEAAAALLLTFGEAERRQQAFG